MKTAESASAIRDQVGTHRAFVRALSAGDLDAATACFARDGCLITPDATAIHGRERVRSLLAQLIASNTEIRVDLSDVLTAAGVVLACERWTVRTEGADGTQIERTLEPTLAMREVEGEWKLAIVAPWGWGGRL
jgi:ketosteroid isomerase-like protein